MKHQIGFDYSEILKGRKTKKDLPLIGRLKRTVDIEMLQDQIEDLLRVRSQANNPDFAVFDPASSEHNYHLKTSKGQSFIRNYDEFYEQYSMIGFQELSDEAKEHASRLDFSVSDLSPVMRLRGMKNTRYEKYHPFYDERNYTKPTRYCEGPVAELLNGFKSEACRSALVCLRPQQYISPHFDIGPEYITRTMVPIFTSPDCVVGVRSDGGYYEFHLPADGGIFFINSAYEHYAINGGEHSRHQIRICLNGQEDLEGLTAVEPVRFISDSDFVNHPCAPVKEDAADGENILLHTLQEFNLERSGGARLT
jgi:hypothetical protein